MTSKYFTSKIHVLVAKKCALFVAKSNNVSAIRWSWICRVVLIKTNVKLYSTAEECVKDYV